MLEGDRYYGENRVRGDDGEYIIEGLVFYREWFGKDLYIGWYFSIDLKDEVMWLF